MKKYIGLALAMTAMASVLDTGTYRSGPAFIDQDEKDNRKRRAIAERERLIEMDRARSRKNKKKKR